ncbi:hypothetical protein [Rosistilla oblonga]|uniref:hypothetical protein n=1 Tax=Rosistilla oblonga TaxID=2527990 RepID=UPI003A983AE0
MPDKTSKPTHRKRHSSAVWQDSFKSLDAALSGKRADSGVHSELAWDIASHYGIASRSPQHSSWTDLVKCDCSTAIANLPSYTDGFVTGLSEVGGDVLVSDIVDARVDRSKMTATARISTPDVDRDRDIILPSGIDVSHYVNNPVVLWNHGFSEISLPLGVSEDGEGNSTLVLGENYIDATCWFTDKFKSAVQIFALVADKVIRAVSARATPQTARIVMAADGHEATLYDSSVLREWSYCPVGANPFALAKSLVREAYEDQSDKIDAILRLNRIEGETIDTDLLKSLTALAPKPTKHRKKK